jgi:hypothetical protein
VGFASLLSVLAISPVAKAQSGAEQVSEFGTLGQLNNNAALTTSLCTVACVPTSVDNGLVYLNDVYGENMTQFQSNPDTYTTVANLEKAMGTTTAGTSYLGEVNGLESFLSPTGADPAPKVAIGGGQYVSSVVGTGTTAPLTFSTPALSSVVQNTLPSASFLSSALQAQDAVTIWIQWGTYNTKGVFVPSGGVHSVTLTSITDNSGSGSISFLDPWGNGNSSSSAAATLNTAKLSTDANGYLELTDVTANEPAGSFEPAGEKAANPLNQAPFDADGAAPPGGWTAIVVADLDEDVVVPEPTTYIAGALLLLPFAFSFFRKSRDTSKTAE